MVVFVLFFFFKKGTYVFHDYTQGIPVENNTSLI